MIHFNAELWNIHQICVFQVLNAKEANPSRKKSKKLAKAEMLRHNFIMLQHNLKLTSRAMSRQAMIYRNKDKLNSS